MTAKKYLGDGVYAENDGFGIILTTENGIETLKSIYLEPSVYRELIRYVENVNQPPADVALLKKAFDAGMNAATFNGRPGISDSPQFEEWLKISKL